MGFLQNIKATIAMQKIRVGGKGKLSESQIVNLLVNLSDAYHNLPEEQFEKVYKLYKEYNNNKQQKTMDVVSYFYSARKIIKSFNEIAPYQMYSGADRTETQGLLDEIEEYAVKIKASGLAYAVCTTIGDVFRVLVGENAYMSSIFDMSISLKYYLDKKSNTDEIYGKIGEAYLYEIAHQTSTPESYVPELINDINAFANACVFEILKSNNENIDDLTACADVAASGFISQYKKQGVIDEKKEEMYTEIFRTSFAKLIESLEKDE